MCVVRLRDSLLRGLPDLERLARKLDGGRINLAELCQMYRYDWGTHLLELGAEWK